MEKLVPSVCNYSQQVEKTKIFEAGEEEKHESLNSCKQCQLYDAEIEELETRCRIAREELAALGTGTTERGSEASEVQVLDNLVNSPQKENVNSLALSDSIVVRKILEYTNEVSLIPLRRVSKLWENVASTLILISNKRSPEPVSIESQYSKLTSTCVRLAYNKTAGVMGKMGMGQLDDLTQLIRSGQASGRLFPSSRFVIRCPHLLACPQLPRFFIEHGTIIQSLMLLFEPESGIGSSNTDVPPPPYSTFMESIRNLLFKLAVNIEYFHLGRMPWPEDCNVRLLVDNKNSLESSTLLPVLPNLKVLNVKKVFSQSGYSRGKKDQLVQDILKVSPNVDHVILEYPYSFWDQLVATHKTGAIKQARYSFEGYGGPLDKNGTQAFIAQHHKSLEDLKIEKGDSYGKADEYPEGWRPPVERLNQVLQNNKDTLRKTTCAQLAFHPGIRIPTMPRLKVLHIKFHCRTLYGQEGNLTDELYFRMFPQDMDVAKCFPCLTEVTLEILDDRNVLNDEGQRPELPCLETLNPLTSVRRLYLVLSGWRQDEFIRSSATLMPQVKHLKVKYDDTRWIADTPGASTPRHRDPRPQVHHILPAVWKYFSCVETLEVELELYAYCSSKMFIRDSLSELMDSRITGLDVKMVRQLKKGRAVPVSMGKETRDQPSILDMKHLKYFRLSMNRYPMFSHISATHAFNLMKNLAVVVQAKYGVKRVAALEDPQGLTTASVHFTNGDPDEKYYFSL